MCTMVDDAPPRIQTNDDDILFAFRERQAIIEVDGKRDPVNAAKLAGQCMRKQFGRVPDCVLEVIKETEKQWQTNSAVKST